jgi:1-acyl-sn-glycerol-3-phosphate acyltransferase
MIRFVCLNIFIAAYSILFCFWAILLTLFDKSGGLIGPYVHVPWSRVILWACGIKVHASGQENARHDEPIVFMCNHQSYFDIFALLAYVPADFRFILKQELMKIPLLGFAMKRAGHIAIERENPREAIRSINETAAKIKSGTSVLIFPEGTRSIDGRLQALKKGGFHMALKSGCDIIPVAISNSYRIVTKGSLKINKGSFNIHFGKPISIRDYDRNSLPQLMDRVRKAILDQMEPDNRTV